MFVEADAEPEHRIKNYYFRIFSLFCLCDETEAGKFFDALDQYVHFHPVLGFQF